MSLLLQQTHQQASQEDVVGNVAEMQEHLEHHWSNSLAAF